MTFWNNLCTALVTIGQSSFLLTVIPVNLVAIEEPVPRGTPLYRYVRPQRVEYFCCFIEMRYR